MEYTQVEYLYFTHERDIHTEEQTKTERHTYGGTYIQRGTYAGVDIYTEGIYT